VSALTNARRAPRGPDLAEACYDGEASAWPRQVRVCGESLEAAAAAVDPRSTSRIGSTTG
jgi:hypothetical protein